jgi:phage-related minor tail protein
VLREGVKPSQPSVEPTIYDRIEEMYDQIAGLTVKVDADIAPLKSDLREAARLSSQFGRSMTTAFEDAMFKGRDLGDVLRNLALSMAKLAFRAAFKPIEQAIGGAFGQMFGGLGEVMPSLFADGGVVAAPTAFNMGNGRTGIAGEAGPEAILPLQRGADGRLGVRSSGEGRAITINFHVTATDAASFRRSEAQINAMLNRAVARGGRNL